MKFELFSIIFISLFQTFILISEEDREPVYLNGNKDREVKRIKSNKNYEFINSAQNYIYFIEIQSNNKIRDTTGNILKNFACLYEENDFIYIDKQNDFDDEIIVYLTSLLNDELNVSIIKDLHFYKSMEIDKNLINLIYVDEGEDQIINLNSFENSVLFSFCKYEFDHISPKQ